MATELQQRLKRIYDKTLRQFHHDLNKKPLPLTQDELEQIRVRNNLYNLMIAQREQLVATEIEDSDMTSGTRTQRKWHRRQRIEESEGDY